MFNRNIVRKALYKTFASDIRKGRSRIRIHRGQDCVISMLIHDIFGGEILKTHENNGWHFYNRIGGERIDFADMETEKPVEIDKFEDIPSNPAETSGYFDKTDYFDFLTKFVRAFEETVGLRKAMYETV